LQKQRDSEPNERRGTYWRAGRIPVTRDVDEITAKIIRHWDGPAVILNRRDADEARREHAIISSHLNSVES
jgi:hypothetical protein